MADLATAEPLLQTPLHGEHVALGARVVPFAGYAMPVQYPTGILAEHAWTRENAGLFDVSHMGQAILVGPDHPTTARALETLVPADMLYLAPGRQRYALLLNEQGGIRDDLMVSRPDDPARNGELALVVNASTKEADYHYVEARRPDGVTLRRLDDRAILALQGPKAEAVLARHAPEAAAMIFMDARPVTIAGIPAHVSRSGYTGEDGFEISVAAENAVALWRLLLDDPAVKPVGLGARDSLRLEAGPWPLRPRNQPGEPPPPSSRSASARAIRCGSRRACASTATTSTRRPRPSRRRWRGRSRAGGARRAAFRARSASRRKWPKSRCGCASA